MSDADYLLVKADALPEVFRKVVEVKRMLDQNEVRSINQAVRIVGISRSAFYKYVGAVRVFEETRRGDTVSLLLRLENYAGVLPRLLTEIAGQGCRVVTLHQDLAIKGLTTVLITIDSEASCILADELAEQLRYVTGVESVQVIT